MSHPYKLVGGRSMAAFWALLTIGTVLAFLGKLDAQFVAFAALLQTFVTARAVADDYTARKFKNEHPPAH